MMTHSKRYNRQIALPEIGLSGQRKLANAKVLVIGAGGLGCPVLQNLAGAGVGCIGIVDGDNVEITNLHRQFLFNHGDLGKNKAETAATAVLRQNAEISVVSYPEYFSESNAFGIVSDYHIVVDCTDNIAARYLINDISIVKGIPMVYASIHKFEGQLSVLNFNGGPSYRCLFPENETPQVNANCEDLGVLGILPNTIGVLQAAEVLKIILGIGTVLKGVLFLYDGLKNETQTVRFQKNDDEIEKGLRNGHAILNYNSGQLREIDAAEFIEMSSKNNHLIIDIRDDYEQTQPIISNAQNISLDQLENYLENTAKHDKIILFCKYGNTSLLAANYLLKNGYTNVSHLKGGIESLNQDQHDHR